MGGQRPMMGMGPMGTMGAPMGMPGVQPMGMQPRLMQQPMGMPMGMPMQRPTGMQMQGMPYQGQPMQGGYTMGQPYGYRT